MHLRRSRTALGVAVLSLLPAALTASASAPAGRWPDARGFRRAATAALLRNEARLLASIDAASVGTHARHLAAGPRVAGTPEAARAAEWIQARLRRWGLPAEMREYDVYLPHARRAGAWLLRDGIGARPLTPFADEASADYPAAAGYSAAGDVTGPVVYANYGRTEDFAALRASGVTVQGAVVLMRFGQLFRGMKVRNAETAGAAAALLYSDPAEDGFARGAVWPAGPFRPANAWQRGSVKVGMPGDPSTPGWASRPGGSRAPPAAEAGLPGIAAVAIGYGAAAELLAEMSGPAAPAAWQGSLAVPYRLGGSLGARARVQVELDEQPVKRIRNVIAQIPGAVEPDAWVIVGAHFDSWTAGATDNASGVAALLEVARGLAALRQAGVQPRRSILLAAWDAEEWGMVGSGEWVEERERQLEHAVAYLNLDGVAGGPHFYLQATPSLAPLLQDAASLVPDPGDPTISVWQARQRRSPSASVELPGGGSDHSAFAARAGVPVAAFGFVGNAGVYHSVNDSTPYMERFGDPGYLQHTAAAAVAAVAAWQLAEADLLPLEPSATARLLQATLDGLSEHGNQVLGAEALRRAAARLAAAADDYARTSAAVLRDGRADAASLVVASRQLLRAEHRLLAPEGLAGDPWQRHRLFAPHPDDAYAVAILPAVAGRIRANDLVGARQQMADLAVRVLAAAHDVEAATRALSDIAAQAVAGS